MGIKRVRTLHSFVSIDLLVTITSPLPEVFNNPEICEQFHCLCPARSLKSAELSGLAWAESTN